MPGKKDFTPTCVWTPHDTLLLNGEFVVGKIHAVMHGKTEWEKFEAFVLSAVPNVGGSRMVSIGEYTGKHRAKQAVFRGVRELVVHLQAAVGLGV